MKSKPAQSPVVKPTQLAGSHRTGTLFGMTVARIIAALGFKSNYADDPDKVENSWAFTVDGEQCAIWDYKGSHHFGQFSTFGPATAFRKLFPDNYRDGN